MKIIRVTIQNLNSLKLKKTIDFTAPPLGNVGLFAITGDTGAGKTTLLDAITLALYGRIHRNKEVVEVMSYGATECLAEVEFETGQGLYRSKWSTYRSRGKVDGNIQPPKRELARWDAKAKAFVIIAEKIREIETKVEKITGLDYDRFTRSVMLSQGDFAAFLRAGERERSDLLERITGTDIYTRISMAAYERYKEEKQKLEDLRRDQQALALLQPDELAAIASELDESRRQAATVQLELEALRQQIQWHLTKSELEQRQVELQEREQQLTEQRTVFADDQQRLKQHRLAQPHQTLLEKHRTAQQNLIDLQEREALITEQLAAIRTELAESRQLVTAQQEQVQLLREDKRTQWPLLDQVIALDAQCREREATFQDLDASLDNAKKEYRTALAIQDELEQRIGQRTQQLEDLEAELQQQNGMAKLGQSLPGLEMKYAELSQISEQQNQVQQRKEQLNTNREALLKEQRSVSDRLAQAREQAEQLMETFRQQTPENFAVNRNDIFQLMQWTIEGLREDREQLRQIDQIYTDYQQVLVEFSEYEERLEILQSAEAAIDKEVMSSLEALDKFTTELTYKQHVFDQQQQIANYEKDRSLLEEGQACPLCLSTHHPFREHGIESFVDQARSDLERARRQHEKWSRSHRSALDRQKELKTELDRLAGQEVVKQHKRITKYEERLANLLQGDMTMTELPSSRKLIQQRLEENEQAIERHKATRDRLSEINKQLNQEEQLVRKLEKEEHQVKGQLHILEERQRSLQEKEAELAEQLSANLKQIKKVFKEQNLSFDLEKAPQQYEALLAVHQQYTEKIEARRKQSHQLDLDRQEAKQGQLQVERLAKQQQELLDKVTTAREKLTELQQQRREMLGDLDPVAEKERLETALDTAVVSLETLQAQCSEQESRLEGSERLLHSKQQDREKVRAQLAELTTQLENIAQQAGFDSVDLLAAALLKPDIATRLEQQAQELEREKLLIEQSLADLKATLAQMAEREMPKASLADLQQHLTLREADYERIQQTIGRLTEKQLADEQRRHTAAGLVEQIKAQEQEFRRWAQLNEVIGQADGKKFRIFAQGLTLSKLVSLANQHLERLNGRYQINKRNDDSLELEIVDTFQADNVRSMNTLSGGESFLVSLALALGLSDLAGRNTRIQSLFIDEGFGTLDDNSLDLAIDTLENLQSDGKTIGVISHVKALKERIGAQIHITKKGTGFSTITMIG